MAQKKIKLFVYGTLKDPKIRKKLLHQEMPIQEATLHNYDVVKEIIQIEGKLFDTIMEDKGQHVHGLLLTVSELDLAVIDLFETEAYKKIVVKTTKGVAMAYVAKELTSK